jgi:hypothetical protein
MANKHSVNNEVLFTAGVVEGAQNITFTNNAQVKNNLESHLTKNEGLMVGTTLGWGKDD